MNSITLVDRLAGIVGAEHVVTGEACEAYAVDGIVPQAVACPSTVDELSEVMKLASVDGFVWLELLGPEEVGDFLTHPFRKLVALGFGCDNRFRPKLLQLLAVPRREALALAAEEDDSLVFREVEMQVDLQLGV